MILGCIFQLIMAFTTFFNQTRIVITNSPMQIRSYGLCQSQEPWFCYIVYQIMELSTLATSLTCYGLFSLKYQVVTDKEVKKLSIVKSFVWFYSPLVLSVILVFYIIKNQTLSWDSQEQLYLLNKILNANSDFITIVSITFKKVPNVLNLMLFIFCFFMVPIMSLYSRKKILRQINHRTENMSEARQLLHKNFVMGLTIQCLLPYVFYIPLYIFYYYSIFTGKEFLFVEFFMTFLPQISSLLNPLIFMYFVIPYREKLVLWSKRKRGEIRTNTAFATS